MGKTRLAGILSIMATSAAALIALAGPAGAVPSVDPYPIFQQPPWHTGFYWNYSEPAGSYSSFWGFDVNPQEHTSNISIVGEASTPRGNAWVVYETMVGSAWESVLVGAEWIPIQVNYSSAAWKYYRMSDLALLNWTIDLTTDTTPLGNATIRTVSHNETVATPPLLEVPWGHPVSGVPWRTQATLTSTGWMQQGGAAAVNTATTAVLDYNSSTNYQPASSYYPTPPFDTYQIVSFGTSVVNGVLGSYRNEMWWAPNAQQKSRDEAGYEITNYMIDWPPAARGYVIMASVAAGGYNDSFNASAYLDHPRGPVTFGSCQVEAPATCSVAPGGQLNISAPAGVNATLFGNVTGSDGLPFGNITQPLVVSVRGPGNPNNAPLFTHDYYFYTEEDTNYTGTAEDFFVDPEGDPMWVFAGGCQHYYIVEQNLSSFTARAEGDKSPASCLMVTAFDDHGNTAFGSMSAQVLGQNDPPWVVGWSPLVAWVHPGGNVSLNAGLIDHDIGQQYAYNWTLDGVPLAPDAYGYTRTYYSPADDEGVHLLSVIISDGIVDSQPVTFWIFTYDAPSITSATPGDPYVHVDLGSTHNLSVVAVDNDTSALYYRWSTPAGVLAEGVGITTFMATFTSGGQALVSVEVSDGDSSMAFVWLVTIHGAPSGLSSIERPGDGARFETNETVELNASLDHRLANATFTWRLDGALVSTSRNDTSPRLSAGNHTIALTVTGWYNGTAPYNETFEVDVEAVTPAPPPPPEPVVEPGPFLGDGVVPTVIAAGAVAFLLTRRRRAAR